MSGTDFDPFGSLGPIHPQDPNDAGEQRDPATVARSPFTPVPRETTAKESQVGRKSKARPQAATQATAQAEDVPAATVNVPAAAIPAGPRRWLPYVAAVVIPLLFGGAVWATSGTPSAAQPPAQLAAEPAPAPAAEPEGPIRMLAMGDMLPHDSVNQNALQADGSVSFASFFDGIQPNLAGADAVFCNQEVPSAGVDLGISGYPTFNTYAEFSRDLRQSADCSLVNLATNHTADMGTAGIAATRAQWDGLEAISVSGANRSPEEQNTIQYGEVRGVKTALLSFAEYSNAPIDEVSLNSMFDDALVDRLLTEARANSQLVIVSAHWGTEDSSVVNDTQRAFAQRVADLGADVVLGTGPHVLQPVEWVPRADGGETLVWYSLGNMLNTQLGLEQRVGLIASFDIVPGADGGRATVTNPAGVLTWMHYDWTAEEEAARQLDARNSLSLQPLAASGDLLARTRYGVTPEQIAAQAAAILGPVVQLSPGM
jgi:poly-gamma-glutamate capsule biosynthesis protein CapA/YwtB (metallophosphatase superfamily)